MVDFAGIRVPELGKDDLRSTRGRGEGIEANILLDLMYWIPLNIQRLNR